MRIIYMGTPEFAVPALEALAAAGHDVVAAYSQPPRPGGRRGRELTPSPVHKRAAELGIEVRHPVSLKGEQEQADFAALKADVAVVAAYGLILPRAVLAAPVHGCLNLHGSLLPRWRGAAPVQRAILAGDAETGVGIMQMEAGLDTGPVRLEGRTDIAEKTTGELTEELAQMGARLIVQVLSDLDAYPPQAQPLEGITYAHKIDKAEARLDFTTSAKQVLRQIRAFMPAPGAFFELEGERYKVISAELAEGAGDPGVILDDALTIACGVGAIRVVQIQRAGKPAMAVADLLRGRPIPAGTRLKSSDLA
ncbi:MULTISPECIES: methionyl-tRNA formyltransferase [unclassified Novosphingobium]|uniref:methionyl-tRNA formyltransferase n=1 Tax=unclassified Novosphingobium TaxID=2644732 RepID=UPI00086D2081|nr:MULTISPECIES: methionyl-tRNA formyltransferase [unclassified Novosphingobium]MBN9143808.1 methionyl-tRNA formyltransferase [Novosphingobium sp.]MDR6706994.1 methionyl-tRNA formyltransferase [Novosphingobium sp. 1748]ODU84406.1 MAG: methionyl-tRNA formyltransferase [Novosphingobium sp. SCN 63-17]OJX92946.1 MAG: methionyl-tRNA formyltransferase [Novosphingobium sp. 63-713]